MGHARLIEVPRLHDVTVGHARLRVAQLYNFCRSEFAEL